MAVTSSVLHTEALQTRRNVPRSGGGAGGGRCGLVGSFAASS